MAKETILSQQASEQMIEEFREFMLRKQAEMVKASQNNQPFVIDFTELGPYNPKLCDAFIEDPDTVMASAREALSRIELPAPVDMRFFGLSDEIMVRDLRAKHIGKFVQVEGIVRKASEIRPEIFEIIWQCPNCGDEIVQERKNGFISKPFSCECGNKQGFKEIGKKMIDTRWIVIEEPFELTEGEKPSQVTVLLMDKLVSPDGRRMTDPGNRLKMSGILRDVPKGKFWSVKLDFYLETSHVEPTETTWWHIDMTDEDREEIKRLAKDPDIYKKLIASLAPSIYGMGEVKEAIILQMFGGVPRHLKDGTHFRGDIHVLLVGDPAAGKSQLLKLVPETVPRGRYVSGKGVTGAGLCMSYDTLVPLAHGQIKKIGDIVEECLKLESKNIEGGVVSKKGDVEIMCLDPADMKIKKKRASGFFKLKYGKDLTVFRTRSGREIEVTQNNPILTVEDGKLCWKKACEMKEGSYIATARHIPLNELTDAIGIPRNPQSDKNFIPEEFLKSNKLLSEFISGLFFSVVERGGGSYVEFATASEKMARCLQTALLRFSVLSDLRTRPPSKNGLGGKKGRYIIVISGADNLKNFHDSIRFSGIKQERLSRIIGSKKGPDTDIDVIPGIGPALGMLRKSLGIKIKNDNELKLLRHYEKGRRLFSREILFRYSSILNERKPHEYFRFLQALSSSDIFWDRVELISKKNAEWVYDLTVEGEHNFIANDFIVHNTATVTKDEQFMGGWVLEAGALVLANGGMISIDEFDKMSPEDQVAMHEALEQGSISIAKASIVATLPAKTSVLAGGNPKFSRFDRYKPIAKQIEIPDTLLSRFDLKFALKDEPNAKKDKDVIDHIMKTREDENYEGSKPHFEPKLLRKYIALARTTCVPEFGNEAGRMLKNYYLKTRKNAQGGDSPIPITLRQFEALMRIAEASAKVQFQPVVRKEDAQRAIALMDFSMQQFGYDSQTGKIDVDLSEGATSHTDRSKIKMLEEILSEMTAEKKEMKKDDILSRAVARGISEADAEIFIERLKREGMLFEPNPGYVQKV